jgi:hypothetical protein
MQFKRKDKHKAYREKVQRYAREEKKLWEDFRHGMMIGSKNFVDKIRSTYLPENLHKEIPQQRDLAKSTDRDNRDLLVLSIWKTGLLTNDGIGRLFGMTYSSVSHIVKSIKLKMAQDPTIEERFNHIYSLFKI